MRLFYRKNRKCCEAITSASPVNTRTAEWIASRNCILSNTSALILQFIILKRLLNNLDLLNPFANVRSAVHVFMGEAGVTFAKR
jgi:hypothetical protein